MGTTGRAERLIQEAGCGPFQIVLVLVVYCGIKIPSTFTMMFMSFGTYNPGWRCLDTINATAINSSDNFYIGGHSENTSTPTLLSFPSGTRGTSASNRTSQSGENTNNITNTWRYKKGSCPDFEACEKVEFDPEASTIVTEWNLLCDKHWIPPLIISIQMAGLLVGSLISGYLGDVIGRKKVMYAALGINGILNIISAFLESWQTFAAVRFLFGIVIACIMSLYCVLPSELLNLKWRGRFVSLPAWAVGGIVFSVTCMLCSDWRKLHLICSGFSFLFFLTGLWVPESLRWLEVKGKTEEFEKVARKIISMNKMTTWKDLKDVDRFVVESEGGALSVHDTKAERPSVLDLFRVGYKLYSVIFGILFLSATMIYYAIGFGVKAMSGNFFINLILYYAIEIPFSVFPVMAPNLIGRKKSSIIFMIVAAAGLLTAAAFETWLSGRTRHTGTLILALLAKTSVDASYYIYMIQTAEVYPTSVRSIANGSANFVAKVGGVLAPFVIPDDQDTLYISYTAMGVVGCLCCGLTALLPETRGQRLKETFDEDAERVN